MRSRAGRRSASDSLVASNVAASTSLQAKRLAAMKPPPARCRRTAEARRELHAERGLVELDLVVAADLVGELLPGRRDGVGAVLRVDLAGEDLGQLVLGDAVVLEDAGDARLDRRVRVVVGVRLRTSGTR